MRIFKIGISESQAHRFPELEVKLKDQLTDYFTCKIKLIFLQKNLKG